ncbi:hypothetical protein PgNI_10704 [Pyricularia grisea]|uniref:Uncharacterized protein n=1 Tax=Pyricularia grisea TaxID=148305 RepID=A0A6P8AX63_PYRGI|nr:hypothetical protein PgNI_10704 [Pyricularia grisea]TLD06930.1 hypothetical protein PgNI_10704 [Pyricularia grisea]
MLNFDAVASRYHLLRVTCRVWPIRHTDVPFTPRFGKPENKFHVLLDPACDKT